MLRIAVTGIAADDLDRIGLRLHAAQVEHCDAFAPENPVCNSADALAFLHADRSQIDGMEAAIRSGKHVLAVTTDGFPADSLDRLASLAREHHALLAIENPDHSLPSRRLIRQHIDSGKLGDVGLVRITRCQPAPATQTPDGSQVPSSLIGDLETATWIIGRSPDTAYAVRRSIAQPSGPSGDFLQVQLGFPFGGMALVSMSTALPSGDAHHSLSVIASTGAAYSDEHQNRQLLFAGGPASAPVADEGDSTAALLDEFAAAAQSPDEPNERLRSWQQLTRIVEAVERSLATQQAVSLEGG